mmetsp:Transcript_32311/g.30816  ORF Transcript_32311/g.30816 Transcript_32311/m.30816 type:complete len:266 (-) Transcript_32311:666-1463(-)
MVTAIPPCRSSCRFWMTPLPKVFSPTNWALPFSFRAAASTSAAEAVFLLTSTYRGVSRSGRDGSLEGIPLGRVPLVSVRPSFDTTNTTILPGGISRLAVSTAACSTPPPLFLISITRELRSSLSPPLCSSTKASIISSLVLVLKDLTVIKPTGLPFIIPLVQLTPFSRNDCLTTVKSISLPSLFRRRLAFVSFFPLIKEATSSGLSPFVSVPSTFTIISPRKIPDPFAGDKSSILTILTFPSSVPCNSSPTPVNSPWALFISAKY